MFADRARHAGTEQVARRGRAQRGEVQAQGRLLAQRRRHGDPELGRQLGGANAEREQHRPARGVREQVRQQLDRAGVGPLHVVEGEDERCLAGDRGQQTAHRAVGAIALLLQAGRVSIRQTLEGGQDDGELGRRAAGQRGEAVGRLGEQPVVEGVGEHAERQLGLELRGASRQHDVTALARVRRQLAQQAALADARLAGDLQDRARRGAVESVERGADRLHLRVATDERRLVGAHRRTRSRSPAIRGAASCQPAGAIPEG